jgi:Family of unknown function (DUF6502)
MHRFLDTILAPLARLLVRRGVLIGAAVERLKLHYVRAAQTLAGPKPTDSRISVMTGLQRRDVVRIAALPDTAPQARKPNHLARLIQVWHSDPRFAGKELDRSGPGDTFETLALAIRRDVHPRTMLEQLREAGTISVTAEGRLRLEQPSYQPLAGSEAQLDYFADNAGDFLTAATDNILAPQPPFFERAAHFNGLSPEAVAQLEALFRAGQIDVLQRVAAKAQSLQRTSPGSHRLRAGGYFYTTDEAGKDDGCSAGS